jgi:hypothetical protein
LSDKALCGNLALLRVGAKLLSFWNKTLGPQPFS